MTTLESLVEWIERKVPEHPILDGLQIIQMGEETVQSPPFLGIVEQGSQTVEQAGVIMHGVSEYDISAQLYTVPASESEQGTPFEDEREMRQAIYDILADRSAIDWITERNFVRVFDIRTTAPITEAEDGQRVTRWQLTIIACPN